MRASGACDRNSLCASRPQYRELPLILLALLFLLVLLVAYANGANDNFKGVATLFGANLTDYKKAITIATIATFAGAIASYFVAGALIQAFSGKGLVPDAVAASPEFLMAVAAGAGSTVLIAAIFGFPISTTHGLIGALIGAGAVAAGDKLDLGVLKSSFLLPLLVSPALAIFLTIPLYRIAHALSDRLGIKKESCVCIAPGVFAPAAAASADISIGEAPACVEKYSGAVFGVTAQKAIDAAHYASGAAVSFARGLNDTPKLVGLMLAVKALDLRIGLVAVAATMAVGGWISARRVAETMSRKISTMNDGQALTGNLVTAFLVIVASRLGMPVSTTHVSVGAITGIGLANGSANKHVIGAVLTSWFLTLPIAATIGAATYLAYRAFAG